MEGTTLRFDEPAGRTYPAAASHVVTLPEYSSVLIQPGAGLLAPPWTGTGGVVAFLVRGTLRNDGMLSASTAGLRGGVGQDAIDERGGCMRADEPAPGGARRGEGLAVDSFSSGATGRGATDTGGGGGMCPFSGGGGGAQRGAGGIGGLARDATTVGGNGGRAHPSALLLLGGGGGATNGVGSEARSGGAGGGVVFARALEVTGFGRIEAHGAPGGDVSSNVGAGSGGGAGGTVWLEVDGEATCAIGANGGAGGATTSTGPGGGGGGGFIRVRAGAVVTCPTSVTAGSPGLANGGPYGAGPLIPSEAPHAGVVDVVQGEPGPPTTMSPAAHHLSATGCGCASGPAPWWALGALGLRRRRA
ncbi:MAG: hypothetical protein JNG84_03345 [Archangium sp.]|nr:hypothetical protein [Archangium sp.]